jgi:hypothetical protein
LTSVRACDFDIPLYWLSSDCRRKKIWCCRVYQLSPTKAVDAIIISFCITFQGSNRPTFQDVFSFDVFHIPNHRFCGWCCTTKW